MGRASVIACCLAWTCTQSGAQEIEQFVGTKRLEAIKTAAKPEPAPAAAKPETVKETKAEDGPSVIAVASPLRRVDFREVVEPIVGTPVPMPDALAATLARKRVVQHISPSLRELSALL